MSTPQEKKEVPGTVGENDQKNIASWARALVNGNISFGDAEKDAAEIAFASKTK